MYVTDRMIKTQRGQRFILENTFNNNTEGASELLLITLDCWQNPLQNVEELRLRLVEAVW